MQQNFQQAKYDLIQQIVNTDDKNMIERLRAVLNEKDFWLELPEAAKASILRGIEDGKNGRKKPHSEVMKKYKKWL